MLDNLEYNSFLLSSARLLVYLYLVFEQVILNFTITKQIISDIFRIIFWVVYFLMYLGDNVS